MECSRVNYIFCCLDICLEQFFCIRPNYPVCVNNFATQLLQPDWLKNKHSHYLCLVNKHYLGCQLTFFVPMSFKRELSLSPREKSLEIKSKKQLTAEMAKVAGDVFSWEMMKNLLDSKLEEKLDAKLVDVARKEDITALRNELEVVKVENNILRKEITKLTSRLEHIDRKTRTSNVVVTGLNCSNSQDAKADFSKLCSEVLDINTNISNSIMIGRRSFIFNLDSSSNVQKVLAAKRKLKGRPIYIQKDYTAQEQNARYNLRQICKGIRDKNKLIKIRQGDLSIFVDDMKVTWGLNNKVFVQSSADAERLEKIFNECKISFSIECNNYKNKPNNIE